MGAATSTLEVYTNNIEALFTRPVDVADETFWEEVSFLLHRLYVHVTNLLNNQQIMFVGTIAVLQPTMDTRGYTIDFNARKITFGTQSFARHASYVMYQGATSVFANTSSPS